MSPAATLRLGWSVGRAGPRMDEEARSAGHEGRWLILGGLVVLAIAAGVVAALVAGGGGSEGEADPPGEPAEAADAVPPAAAAESGGSAPEAPAPQVLGQQHGADLPGEEAVVAAAAPAPEVEPPPASESASVAMQAEGAPDHTATEREASIAPGQAQAAPEEAVPLPDPGFGPFTMPIAAACLPAFAGQLPNAPRAYRNGIHEGVDLYSGAACARIQAGTPVLAMAPGTVVRADWEYAELTVEQYFAMKSRGFAGPDDVDTFRGRQVWIDHSGGVATRYAHLGGIAEGIALGVAVAAGDVLGFVGESGTPGGLRAPGSEVHLHFEVRVGTSYLGAGLATPEVLALYQALFPSPAAPAG